MGACCLLHMQACCKRLLQLGSALQQNKLCAACKCLHSPEARVAECLSRWLAKAYHAWYIAAAKHALQGSCSAGRWVVVAACMYHLPELEHGTFVVMHCSGIQLHGWRSSGTMGACFARCSCFSGTCCGSVVHCSCMLPTCRRSILRVPGTDARVPSLLPVELLCPLLSPYLLISRVFASSPWAAAAAAAAGASPQGSTAALKSSIMLHPKPHACPPQHADTPVTFMNKDSRHRVRRLVVALCQTWLYLWLGCCLHSPAICC
jgi:hypothetical protein